MKSAKILTILVVALGLMVCQAKVSEAAEMGTAFTYQGQLYDGNYPTNGLYDFQFKLYDANSDGNQIGSDVNKPDVDVIDAYFTVELDFGSVFDGNERWLDIGVRPGALEDPNGYTPLDPRQEVTPTPYALYAANTAGDNDWMVSGNDMYSIPSGNVGIGTTSPNYALEVSSYGAGDNNVIVSTRTRTDVKTALWSSDAWGNLGTLTNHPLSLFVNNGPGSLIISKDGNVGIGTPSPNSSKGSDGYLDVKDVYLRDSGKWASEPEGVAKVYRSEWFPVETDQTYTKAHGLGAYPDFVQVLIAENSDGSGWCIQAPQLMGGGQADWPCQFQMVELTSTNVVIRTDYNGVNRFAFFWDKTGTILQSNSGYCRIVAIKY